ncbi:Lcl domain-containing protein [Winogradskyella endarachnes]|uniref:DUF1566 domain-containing protein n=1 Tax=Winogradskyella endarachnes TaxID=2681965 RepID=A0A6L6U8U3_9FLAO|nr:DUF1566 domain-containing protein [Winogradskyella endarachnes]MUU78683.1 DUF1566 domain-containing protein [Winogradskyella endarachnes]
MKKILLLIIASTNFFFTYSQVTYPIVDTDVSDFYDNNSIIAAPTIGQSFYGQDAHYNGNQPSYTNNGDGTITDNITGLMWEQDMGTKITYDAAFIKASNSTLGGYNDWRVPTIKELYSLAYFTGRCFGDDAVIKFIDTNYFNQPIGDESIGEREIDAQTWSSTQYVGLTMASDEAVFGYNFVDGRLKGYPKYDPSTGDANTMYFRLVRGNTSYGINNFVDNGDGTITDNATGLMWQQADDGNTRDWENALSYCENLTLAGHSDWRLPNAKELQSIVDYTRSPTTTASPAIDPLFSCTSISDPNGNTGQYGYYWSSSPLQDGPEPYSDAVYFCFGKAQGLMELPSLSGNYQLLDVHGAGAQRNDPKSGNQSDFPDYFGPQGDVRYVYNFVRAVRSTDVSLSVNEQNFDNSLKIYPNPSSSEITIDLPENINLLAIEIFNIQGRRIKKITNISESKIIINVSDYSKGTYFLKLSTSGNKYVKKIVVD